MSNTPAIGGGVESGGTGGFIVPSDSPFASIAARNTWASANSSKLHASQTIVKVNPDQWWLWNGTIWEDADPILQGNSGVSPHIGVNGNWYIGIVDTGITASADSGLSLLPSRSVPMKGTGNKLVASGIEIGERGLVKIPESTLGIGDPVTLGSATGFGIFHNEVTGLSYLIVDCQISSTNGSSRPNQMFVQKPRVVNVQPDGSESIKLNPLTFNSTVSETSGTFSVELETNAEMKNVKIEIVDSNTGIAFKHLPTKKSWNNAAEPGMNFRNGVNTLNFFSKEPDDPANGIFNLGYTPIMLGKDWELTINLKADSVDLKGNSAGLPQLKSLRGTATFRGLAFKDELDSILQPDWNVTDTDSKAFVKNKPTIPSQYTSEMALDAIGAALTAGDNITITVDDDANTITIKSTASGGAANIQSDWDETDTANDAFIKSKPIIPSPEKSDWNESDVASLAFILNKPTIPAGVTNENIMDVIAEMIVNGVHQNIVVTYDDDNDSISINLADTEITADDFQLKSDSTKTLSSVFDRLALDDEIKETIELSGSVNITATQWDNTYRNKSTLYKGSASIALDMPDVTDAKVKKDDHFTYTNDGTGLTYLRGRGNQAIGLVPRIIVRGGESVTIKTDKVNWYQVSRVKVSRVAPGISLTSGGVILQSASKWDASAGTFPSASQVGYLYPVSKDGTMDSVEFHAGDFLLARADVPSTTVYADNWLRIDGADYIHSIGGMSGIIDDVEFTKYLTKLLVARTGQDVEFSKITSKGDLDVEGSTNLADLNATSANVDDLTVGGAVHVKGTVIIDRHAKKTSHQFKDYIYMHSVSGSIIDFASNDKEATFKFLGITTQAQWDALSSSTTRVMNGVIYTFYERGSDVSGETWGFKFRHDTATLTDGQTALNDYFTTEDQSTLIPSDLKVTGNIAMSGLINGVDVAGLEKQSNANHLASHQFNKESNVAVFAYLAAGTVSLIPHTAAGSYQVLLLDSEEYDVFDNYNQGVNTPAGRRSQLIAPNKGIYYFEYSVKVDTVKNARIGLALAKTLAAGGVSIATDLFSGTFAAKELPTNAPAATHVIKASIALEAGDIIEPRVNFISENGVTGHIEIDGGKTNTYLKVTSGAIDRHEFYTLKTELEAIKAALSIDVTKKIVVDASGNITTQDRT